MAGGAELLLINAAIGGATSAIAGGDPLKGALLGAVGGGIAGGLGGGVAGAGTGTGLAAAPAATTAASGAANYALAAPAAGGAGGLGLAAPAAELASVANLGSMTPGLSSAVDYSLAASTAPMASSAGVGLAPPATALSTTPAAATADAGMFGGLKNWWGGLKPAEKLLYGGGAGMGALMLAERMGAPDIPSGEYEGPLKRFRYSPGNYVPGRFAEGGITALAAGGYDKMVGDMPSYQALASGGISDLGSYSDGGRMLKGPGDGMSDNIPGVIANKRPARLADGEFVVPADVVSHLGNGSTDAGARQLYAMMDRVRQKRTGTKRQGRQINPASQMPA